MKNLTYPVIAVKNYLYGPFCNFEVCDSKIYYKIRFQIGENQLFRLIWDVKRHINPFYEINDYA